MKVICRYKEGKLDVFVPDTVLQIRRGEFLLLFCVHDKAMVISGRSVNLTLTTLFLGKLRLWCTVIYVILVIYKYKDINVKY